MTGTKKTGTVSPRTPHLFDLKLIYYYEIMVADSKYQLRLL